MDLDRVFWLLGLLRDTRRVDNRAYFYSITNKHASGR